MKLRRLTALMLGLCLLTACSPKEAEATPTPAPTPSESAAPAETPTPTPTPAPTPAPTPSLSQDEAVRVSMLKGPTGLGAARWMDQRKDDPTVEATVFAEPTQAVAALTNGEVDIAALPTNLAATLYNKTGGEIQLLCLNTLGVLYILENGETVDSLADLEGRTLYAYGQGANPQYALDHLLELSGADPAKVDIQWKGTTDEIAALMASGEADLCMLPVPAATAVLMQNDSVRKAVSLSDVWTESETGGAMPMGCLVVRRAFAQEDPEAVEAFLAEYEASIAFMADSANVEQAAALAETFGIVPKAAVAKAALPDANLYFSKGSDMIGDIQGYYEVLYAADPASVGGAIPDGAFYYGVQP